MYTQQAGSLGGDRDYQPPGLSRLEVVPAQVGKMDMTANMHSKYQVLRVLVCKKPYWERFEISTYYIGYFFQYLKISRTLGHLTLRFSKNNLNVQVQVHRDFVSGSKLQGFSASGGVGESESTGRVIACAQTQTLNENICSEIHSQTQVELLTASELPRALEIT